MEYQPLDEEDLEPINPAPHESPGRSRGQESFTGNAEQSGPDEAHLGPAEEAGAESEHTPISDQQLAANRQNAKRSTGPRTEAGKRSSAQNAIKHGYYARRAEPIRRGALAEDEEEFRDQRQAMIESLHPRYAIEEALADAIAENVTTSGRLTRYAALMLSNDGKRQPPDPETFRRLGLDAELLEGLQEEIAARKAVKNTFAQTIPKMASLVRQQTRLIEAYRLLQKEPPPEGQHRTQR
jgi:hypothetical protein